MAETVVKPPPRLTSFDLDVAIIRKFGYWSSPDEKRLRRIRNMILFGFVFVQTIPVVISIVENGVENAQKTVRASGELLSLVLNIMSSVTIIRKKQKLQDVLNKFQLIFERSMEEGNPEIVQLLKHTEALSKKVSYYMMRFMGYLNFLYCGIPFVYTVFCIYFLYYEPVPFSTGFESNFYYINIHYNIWLYTGYMALFLVCVSIMAVNVGFKNTLFGHIINHCTINFRILKQKIELLDSLPDPETDDMDLWSSKLMDIIDLHNDSFECVEILDDTFNGLLLGHNMGCVAILCLQMLCFTVMDLDIYMALRLFIIFSYISGEICAFSWMGDRLSQSSSDIADAIYASKWYGRPVPIQKALQLILARSQRSTGVTVGTFFNLDMCSLGSSLNSVYTYFLFIKQVYDGME